VTGGRLLTPIADCDTLSPSAILQSVGSMGDLLREDSVQGSGRDPSESAGQQSSQYGRGEVTMHRSTGLTPGASHSGLTPSGTGLTPGTGHHGNYSYVPELEFNDREVCPHLHPRAYASAGGCCRLSGGALQCPAGCLRLRPRRCRRRTQTDCSTPTHPRGWGARQQAPSRPQE